MAGTRPLESNLTSSNQFDMREIVVGKAASLAFVARVGYACWVKNALRAGLDISTHELFIFILRKGNAEATMISIPKDIDQTKHQLKISTCDIKPNV